MFLPYLALAGALAAASPAPTDPEPIDPEPIDLRGRSAGAATVALIVASPGFAQAAYEPLGAALEARGLDAWLLHFPAEAQNIRGITQHSIPSAMARFDGRTVGLVGHGIGGTLVALSLADPRNGLDPAAIALLGAPLRLIPSPLFTWMAAATPSTPTLNLAAFAPEWAGRPALPLLLGSPLPPLEAVSSAFLETTRSWVEGGLQVDLGAAFCPIWAGVGDHDNLAPPESVRLALPERATFVRFGYLRGDPRDYDNAALLSRPRPTAALATWLQRRLKGAARSDRARRPPVEARGIQP